jgi:hypothetical protein
MKKETTKVVKTCQLFLGRDTSKEESDKMLGLVDKFLDIPEFRVSLKGKEKGMVIRLLIKYGMSNEAIRRLLNNGNLVRFFSTAERLLGVKELTKGEELSQILEELSDYFEFVEANPKEETQPVAVSNDTPVPQTGTLNPIRVETPLLRINIMDGYVEDGDDVMDGYVEDGDDVMYEYVEAGDDIMDGYVEDGDDVMDGYVEDGDDVMDEYEGVEEWGEEDEDMLETTAAILGDGLFYSKKEGYTDGEMEAKLFGYVQRYIRNAEYKSYIKEGLIEMAMQFFIDCGMTVAELEQLLKNGILLQIFNLSEDFEMVDKLSTQAELEAGFKKFYKYFKYVEAHPREEREYILL